MVTRTWTDSVILIPGGFSLCASSGLDASNSANSFAESATGKGVDW